MSAYRARSVMTCNMKSIGLMSVKGRRQRVSELFHLMKKTKNIPNRSYQIKTRCSLSGRDPMKCLVHLNQFNFARNGSTTMLTSSRKHVSKALKRRTKSVECSAMSVPMSVTALVHTLSEQLETAPPAFHLMYLMLAGLGVPLSEDALCISVGASLSKLFGMESASALSRSLKLIPFVYIGVVLSDILTFLIGMALKNGLMKGLLRFIRKDEQLMSRATGMVSKWGLCIGLVQRFMIGFRGPLCLIAGLTGVQFSRFCAGVLLGAALTLPLQLAVGHILRDSSSPYLTSLALVATPNAIGHLIGPIAACFGLWTADKRASHPSEEEPVQVNNDP